MVNDAALDFWQLPRKAVLGHDETLIFPPEEAQNLLAIDETILHQGLSKTLEECVTLRGQTYTFLTTKTPYHDQRGQVIGLVGITRDITRRKQAENSLLQKTEELQAALGELQKTQSHLIHSEKMSSLGQLVAGVAHEINNPVNFIYGNTKPAESYILDLLNLIDLYQRHFPHPPTEIQDQIELIDLDFILEDLPKILRSIKVGAERIHDIVQSLRNFSRMNESNVKVVDIHEGIDSTLMILQPRLKALPNRESVILEKQYGPLPPVECYAGQLNQVIMNLLANALDAVDDRNSQEPNFQPHITIATHPIPGPQILIQITDNGVGIPDSLVSRLFDPFFTTKPVGKGTGMGLAISYQIITELHQGHLTVRSTPGLGTTFTIAIPQSQHRTLERDKIFCQDGGT